MSTATLERLAPSVERFAHMLPYLANSTPKSFADACSGKLYDVSSELGTAKLTVSRISRLHVAAVRRPLARRPQLDEPAQTVLR